jgi:alpha-amylase
MSNSTPLVQLCLVLHNHQPIGNFDNVFEASYQDSYLPFLNLFEQFPAIRISLHTSGCLMQWLNQHHPEYLDRLSTLVAQGRVEIVGGAFYEPILTMIPARDRVGQITSFTHWLEQRLGGKVSGMWIPERVWESALTADLAAAEIQYTILDDYHFRCAGLNDDELYGYYITEDQGRVVRVFPGSERLRYLIPFADPWETIEYCRAIGEAHPGAVLVFGDDGEKFGTWPDTKRHVYEEGWLERFFTLLTENQEWLRTSTLADTIQSTRPHGKIYLPDASYREMTEWALPVAKQNEYESLVHEFEQQPGWASLKRFMRGGFWRNFKVKYPESNEMYSRMMYVSSLVQQAEQEKCPAETLDVARKYLYQGQCNCAYWHGAFGGVYLPHLRNAIYQNLILAEEVIERWSRQRPSWIEGVADDYNFDGLQEIRLANESLTTWISPQVGGQIYELDVRANGHNLLATMQRREEAYHAKVLKGHQQVDGEAASIHDRIVLKRNDLNEYLNYDQRLRKSLVDHFWDENVSLSTIAAGRAVERGDFAEGSYRATIRRNPERIQVMLEREGNAWGVPLKLTKGVTLNQRSSELEIAYLLEGLPQGSRFHFGVEFNFSGLPEGQGDRFFSTGSDRQRRGHLGERLDLQGLRDLRLTDQWLGLDIGLEWDRPGGIWTFPIHSVNGSEAGFELVHQSVVVQPHFIVEADREGRWALRMRLSVNCNKPVELLKSGDTLKAGSAPTKVS